MQDIVADFFLICKNAMVYNDADTEIQRVRTPPSPLPFLLPREPLHLGYGHVFSNGRVKSWSLDIAASGRPSVVALGVLLRLASLVR